MNLYVTVGSPRNNDLQIDVEMYDIFKVVVVIFLLQQQHEYFLFQLCYYR